MIVARSYTYFKGPNGYVMLCRASMSIPGHQPIGSWHLVGCVRVTDGWSVDYASAYDALRLPYAGSRREVADCLYATGYLPA